MSGADTAAVVLERLELFAGSDPARLDELASRLELVHKHDGEILMRQGEAAAGFAVIVEGEVVVERSGAAGRKPLGVVGSGSIVGELALLRGSPRTATVTARGPVSMFVGDREAFALLLGVPGVRERVTRRAGQNLAAHATPTKVVLRDGTDLAVRPLLPTDRDELAAAVQRLSDESRRLRFFSAGNIPQSFIDYLVDLDYIDHFAWGALAGNVGIGVSRYIRSRTDRHSAEAAVTVADAYQGRGLGRVLLGALAVAAQAGQVQLFTGTVLRENVAMRTLLDRGGARWTAAEPGVLEVTVEVGALAGVLEPALAESMRASAERTMSAAHVAM